MPRFDLRRFLDDVDPSALRIMIASLIMSSLMMGIFSVTRALFILRLGMGPEFFGIYNAFGAIGYTGMALPAGLLGRRLGLRRSMLLGAWVFGIGCLLTPLIESAPRALWAACALMTQAISTAGYALFSVNAAPALMTFTRSDNRAKIYGMLSASHNLGALLGMLGGGSLPALMASALALSLADTDPYRLSLLASGVLNLLAIYAVALCRDAENAPVARERTGRWDQFPILPMGLLLVHILLGQSALVVSFSFFNAYMDEELGLSPQFIGVLGALGQACAVFVPFAIPWLRRRMDNGLLLFASTLLSALLLLPISFLNNWQTTGLGRMGLMVLASIWNPVMQMYQMEMVLPEWRTFAYALNSMALGLNFGLLNFFGGYTIGLWGYQTLFLGCALVTALGSLLLSVQRLPIMQAQYAQ